MRVRDQGTGHDDQIGLTAGDDFFCLGGACYPACGDDRRLDHFPNGAGEGSIGGMRERHVGDGLGLADECFRSAANDAVVIDDSEGIEPDRDFFHCVIVQTTPGEIIAGHPDADDKIVAAPLRAL